MFDLFKILNPLVGDILLEIDSGMDAISQPMIIEGFLRQFIQVVLKGNK